MHNKQNNIVDVVLMILVVQYVLKEAPSIIKALG
jgi:hypothetical protein